MGATESACFQDRGVSIDAVGEAMLAVKKQLNDLLDEDERLMAKRLLIHQKMDICLQEITRLYLDANPGFKPKAQPHYPELHMID